MTVGTTKRALHNTQYTHTARKNNVLLSLDLVLPNELSTRMEVLYRILTEARKSHITINQPRVNMISRGVLPWDKPGLPPLGAAVSFCRHLRIVDVY